VRCSGTGIARQWPAALASPGSSRFGVSTSQSPRPVAAAASTSVDDAAGCAAHFEISNWPPESKNAATPRRDEARVANGTHTITIHQGPRGTRAQPSTVQIRRFDGKVTLAGDMEYSMHLVLSFSDNIFILCLTRLRRRVWPADQSFVRWKFTRKSRDECTHDEVFCWILSGRCTERCLRCKRQLVRMRRTSIGASLRTPSRGDERMRPVS
jgi:hypothetical protein